MNSISEKLSHSGECSYQIETEDDLYEALDCVVEAYQWHMEYDRIYTQDHANIEGHLKTLRRLLATYKYASRGGQQMRMDVFGEFWLEQIQKGELHAWQNYIDQQNGELLYLKQALRGIKQGTRRRVPVKAAMLLWAICIKVKDKPLLLEELKIQLSPLTPDTDRNCYFRVALTSMSGIHTWEYDDSFIPLPNTVGDHTSGKLGWYHRYKQVLQRSFCSGLNTHDKSVIKKVALVMKPYDRFWNLGTNYPLGCSPKVLIGLYSGAIQENRGSSLLQNQGRIERLYKEQYSS